MRNFFRVVTEWHRYIATSGESRPIGRAITGASNLAFLFIVISGPFLWWPRTWTWAAVRNITWFRGGLPGKARDFNWHDTIGFWSAIPLAIVVAGGVVISYPWASGLVYRAYGEAPPVSAVGPGLSPAEREQARQSGGASELRDHDKHAPGEQVATLELMWARAEAQMPGWRSISLALPAPGAPRAVRAAGVPRAVFTLDAGDGGQPDKRATLTLDGRTGEIVRWEPFSIQSPGRRARTWLRFAHTGEVYGLAGQTIAGIVSAGGAVLVWTGLALAFRRFTSWRIQSESRSCRSRH